MKGSAGGTLLLSFCSQHQLPCCPSEPPGYDLNDQPPPGLLVPLLDTAASQRRRAYAISSTCHMVQLPWAVALLLMLGRALSQGERSFSLSLQRARAFAAAAAA